MNALRILRFARDFLVLSLGVLIASFTAEGIAYADKSSLLLVVLVLAVFNLVLKPFLIVFALPFVLLTMGLGIWLINALLFYLAANFIDGFTVAGFPSAMWGALWVSLVHFGIAVLFGQRPRMKIRVNVQPPSQGNKPQRSRRLRRRDNDDVIDV